MWDTSSNLVARRLTSVTYCIVSECLEGLEAHQLNLGLYTTRVTAEDLRRAMAEAEGTALSLTEIEAALQDLVVQGEVIEWAPGYFCSRIAETVRCLRLLRQRLWWQRDLSDAPLLVEDIRVEFRQRRRPKRDTVRTASPPGTNYYTFCPATIRWRKGHGLRTWP